MGLFGNSRAGITLEVGGNAIGVINKLRLGLEAGFNEKAMDKYMQVAVLDGAKFLTPLMAEAAPVGNASEGDPHPGRLRGSVRWYKGRYKKPSAIAGIYPGKTRDDETGAYYGRAVVAGVGNEASYPGTKAARGLIREYVRKNGMPLNRQGVRYANQLSQERNLFAKYRRTPMEARPFVNETGEQYRDQVKDVVQKSIERIIEDDSFRGTIKIGRR